MKIKSILIFAFVLASIALTVGLFSCDRIVSVASDGKVPQTTGEEIPIGVVVALTGKYAEPYGFPMQRGFELAREEINRRRWRESEVYHCGRSEHPRGSEGSRTTPG